MNRNRRWLAVAMVLAGLVGAWACRDDDASEAAGGGVLEGLAGPQKGRSMRATSAMRVGELRRGPDGDRNAGERSYDPTAVPRGDADVKSNWDNFNVPAGGTHVLLDEKGPGVITHMWITFLGPEPQGWATRGSADHQELMLRIYWDGDPRPAVEAPVGDFFANCFGRRSEVISVPVVVEGGDSYNAFWRMPFRQSARIEIENQSDKPLSLLYYNIDWIRLDDLPAATPYFYAQYRQEYPVLKGQDYVLLETKGRGHFVGAVLGVRMRSPAWFGEGDEKIYIDGETTPSIWGTGTEDYFLAAWGLETSSTPYFGVPFFDDRTIGGHVSSYRWHLHDPVVFRTGIKVTLEHWGWMSEDENPAYQATSWNEREDDYASVAFWYQTGEPTFTYRAPGSGRTTPARPGPDGRARVGFRRSQAARRRRDREGGRTEQRRRLPRVSAGPSSGGLARIPDLRRGEGAFAAADRRDAVAGRRPLPGFSRWRENRRAARLLREPSLGIRLPSARLLARAGPAYPQARLCRQKRPELRLCLRARGR